MSRETMRAAVINELGQLPEIEDVPVPTPSTGQALVRLDSSGICHTDVHLSTGVTAVDEQPARMPIIPGHEGAGVVVALGDGVEALEVGDRVVIGWLGGACGECPECRTGHENLCRYQQNPGNSYHGTLSEYALVWARSAAIVPAGLSLAEAGPLGCAGVAAFGTTMRAGIAPGDLVSVVGVGGLGHLAVQYAVLAGARVAAVDIDDAKLATAADLGAELCINPNQEDPAEHLQRLGGAHAVLIFAASESTISQGLRSLRRAGTLALAGWPIDDPVPTPMGLVIQHGLRVVGSDGGTLPDLERVLQLHASGRARLIYEERTLDEVPRAFADIHEGRGVSPRVVIRIEAPEEEIERNNMI